MSYIRVNYLAALVLGAVAIPAATAQNVVFSGSSNPSTGQPYSIPLLSGSQVTVEPDGDVRLSCAPNGSGGCVGFPTGGTIIPANAPTVSLSSSAGSQVAVGAAFSVNATLGNNPESCLRTSSPLVDGWDGAVVPGLANASVVLSQAVAHTLSLKCFNDAGAGSGAVTVTGTSTGGGGGGVCGDTSGFNTPTGYTRDNSVTALATLPISSQARAFKFFASKYLAMGFKGATDFPASSSLTLAAGTVGGVTLRYSGFYMTISPCAGDLRPALNAANTTDPTRAIGCRTYVPTPEGDFLLVNFNNGPPSNSHCNLDPNVQYYMNIVLDDPAGGLNPAEPFECISTNCGNGLSIR